MDGKAGTTVKLAQAAKILNSHWHGKTLQVTGLLAGLIAISAIPAAIGGLPVSTAHPTDPRAFFNTLPARILVFPPRLSFGTIAVMHYKDGRPTIDTKRPFAAAMGSVHVPAKLPIMLIMSYEASGDMKRLDRFQPNDFQGLDLYRTQVTDESIAHVSRLRGLQCLRLNEDDITDKGLANLEPLSNLQVLFIARTEVTGKAFPQLAKLPQLKQLYMLNNAIYPCPELAAISKMKELEHIDMQTTKVGDDFAEHLTKLPNLRSLLLKQTNITDKGIRALSKCDQLVGLNVSATNITDASVPSLLSMKHLENIDVSSTHITPKGVAALSKRFKNVSSKKETPKLKPLLDALEGVGAIFGGKPDPNKK